MAGPPMRFAWAPARRSKTSLMHQVEQTRNPWMRLRRWFAARPALCAVIGLLACPVVPMVYQVLIEFTRIRSVTTTLQYLEARVPNLLLGWAPLALLFLALTLLTRRPAIPAGVMGVVLAVGGIANYLKLSYRDEPVVPSDLFILRDAATIGTEMKPSVTREMVVFALAVILITVALSFVRIPWPRGRRGWALRVLAAVAALAAACTFIVRVLWNEQFMKERGLGYFATSMADEYYRGSFVTMFLHLTGDLKIDPPAGYNRTSVEQLAREMADEAGESGVQATPDILIVMSESWFDLERVIPGTYSEDLTANFDRLAREGVSGYFLSEGYTGGTANIEFAALTGFCTNLLPQGSTAYSEFMHPDFAGYPLYLKQQGYTTLAIHPYLRRFYDRTRAYEDMGFDAFYDMEDFENPVYAGDYISEDSTIDKIIETYEQATAETDGGVFIHTVTMQNHVSYQGGVYPDGYRVTARVDGLNPEETALLETVATNMRDIDQALGKLTDYLETVDRDVIVLFFGDHQTGVADDEGINVNEKAASYRDLADEALLVEKHKVPFLIWSNHDKKNAETEPLTSAYMLLPLLCAYYDAPEPAWMGWLHSSLDVCRGLARGYAIAPDGSVSLPEGETQALLDDYWTIQYDLMFGKEYSRNILYG